ncbi:MAG: hypothetical protein ACTS7D_00460 [Candidatus Hodgkinia cicadicola]
MLKIRVAQHSETVWKWIAVASSFQKEEFNELPIVIRSAESHERNSTEVAFRRLKMFNEFDWFTSQQRLVECITLLMSLMAEGKLFVTWKLQSVGGCNNPLRTAIKPINSVPMNSRTSCYTKTSERS